MINPLKLACVATTATVMGILSTSMPSLAASFNFSYSGQGVNTSGILTLGDFVIGSGGGYLMTDVTGQRNGTSITALIPPGDDPESNSDNLFFPDNSRELVSSNGFTYTAGGTNYNVSFDVLTSYVENNGNRIDLDSFTATPVTDPKPVPEPSTTAGLLAIAAMGAGSLFRKKVML